MARVDNAWFDMRGTRATVDAYKGPASAVGVAAVRPDGRMQDRARAGCGRTCEAGQGK